MTKEQRAEYMRLWNARNPERLKANQNRRRQKMKSLGITGHENRDPASVLRSSEKQNEKYRSDPAYRQRIRTHQTAKYREDVEFSARVKAGVNARRYNITKEEY